MVMRVILSKWGAPYEGGEVHTKVAKTLHGASIVILD